MSRTLTQSRPITSPAAWTRVGSAGRARSRRWHAVLVAAYALLATAALVSRRPDAVLNAQFYAEDGRLWFADAYNHGWSPLVWSYNGYHQLTSSMVGVLAQPLGFGAAPLLFNAVALILQILPALFILSSRFEGVVPSLRMRCVIGAMYLAIPSAEVHANLTNAHWHWALLTLMVILARPAATWRWRVVDITVLVLGGLSGPLAIALAPLALVRWVTGRDGWHRTLAVTACLVGAVQAISAVGSAAERSHAPLGGDLRVLAQMVVNRVVLTGMSGQESTLRFSRTPGSTGSSSRWRSPSRARWSSAWLCGGVRWS